MITLRVAIFSALMLSPMLSHANGVDRPPITRPEPGTFCFGGTCVQINLSCLRAITLPTLPDGVSLRDRSTWQTVTRPVLPDGPVFPAGCIRRVG